TNPAAGTHRLRSYFGPPPLCRRTASPDSRSVQVTAPLLLAVWSNSSAPPRSWPTPTRGHRLPPLPPAAQGGAANPLLRRAEDGTGPVPAQGRPSVPVHARTRGSYQRQQHGLAQLPVMGSAGIAPGRARQFAANRSGRAPRPARVPRPLPPEVGRDL